MGLLFFVPIPCHPTCLPATPTTCGLCWRGEPQLSRNYLDIMPYSQSSISFARMGIQVALYPTPVEQSESYAIRSLQLPPTPGRRLSSSSALSEEINTAFQINEDILYLPSTRFRADEKSTRRGTGNESFTLIPTTYNSNRTLKGKKTMGSSPGPSMLSKALLSLSQAMSYRH